MQRIDAAQCVTPDRLHDDEITAWDPANYNAQYGNPFAGESDETGSDLYHRSYYIWLL